MTPQPAEPLTTLELLALTLASADGCDSDAADAIPQRVWDELHARNLITTVRDITGDGHTDATNEGEIALHEWIEYSAAVRPAGGLTLVERRAG